MTRQEAIKQLQGMVVGAEWLSDYMVNAIEMAIEALQDRPTGDLISRADAIEVVQRYLDILIGSRRHGDDFTFINTLTGVRNALSALPSAEAKRVLQGYCKGADCTWWNPQISGCNRCVSVQDEYTHTSAEATCATCADRAVCIMSAPDGNWKACKDYRPSAEAVEIIHDTEWVALRRDEYEDFLASAEAVHVVRCKDCIKKHIGGSVTHYYWCDLWDMEVDCNNYCSWAERKGGEDE